jgi:hypothetical protein
MEIENGIKNLLRDQDNLDSLPQEQESKAKLKERALNRKMQIEAEFEARMKESRAAILASRRQTKLDKRLKLAREGDKAAAPASSTRELSSGPSQEPDLEGQAEGARVLAKYRVTCFKPKDENADAETEAQSELVPYEGTEMDIEMSDRIARLEV